ncbi:MAG: hypothetical protein ABFS14_01970 [Gemmatimonadota bacterium]
MSEAGNVDFIGGSAAGESLKHPVLTARWLRNALSANKSAFEREMRRERRTLDDKFDQYWKESSDRQD